ncbi:hypothetical protein GC163_02130 [bacterium]|nr:hypothetical protein [bacterium]
MALRPRVSIYVTCLACVISWTASGCGGGSDKPRVPVYPVKGTLTLDGKPLGNMALQLDPIDNNPNDPKPSTYATVGQDGSFALSTYSAGDGAPEGSYEVTLGTDPMNPVALPNHAPVQVDIKKDTGTLAIDLKSTRARSQGAGIPLAN